MRLMFGLTKGQMLAVFQEVRSEYIKDDIKSILDDTTYNYKNQEIEGSKIKDRLDLDYIAERFLDKDDFNWELLEDIINDEIDKDLDYVMTGKEY